ncbi:MAG: hypothetical protein ACREQT_05395 [Candidatus Binataceae bacterium]
MIHSSLPHRIFLDTGVLQYLLRFGESIFENVEVCPDDPVHRVPEALSDIEGMRMLCFMNQRNAFELVVSESSLKEVLEARSGRYTSWLVELWDYWCGVEAAYNGAAYHGFGTATRQKVAQRQFDYLSAKDRALIADAGEKECDTFLTVDRRLARNGRHLRRELEISVMTPTQIVEVLQPWAGLLP